MDISKMKIFELKQQLKTRGLKVTGNKSTLTERLRFAIKMNTIVPKYKTIRSGKNERVDNSNDDVNLNQSAPILEMPIEMLEYIFDYLDVDDLVAVGKTCKRMQQIADHCYQQNYSGLWPYFEKTLSGDGMVYIRRFGDSYCVDVEHFSPVFDKLSILRYEKNRTEVFYKFVEQKSEFCQLKHLSISHQDLTDCQAMESVSDVLIKLEYLQLIGCQMNGEFLESLLIRAPNMKRLSFHQNVMGNEWLSRCYPTLQYCEITSQYFVPITKFLKLNPNIQKFGTDLEKLSEIMHLMKADDIKLEELAILINDSYFVNGLHYLPLWQLLNQQHQLGIYKRLNLVYECVRTELNQKAVDEITNLTGLNKFECVRLSESVALSGLAHLKDLSFIGSKWIEDIENVAANFKCLKRIRFGYSIVSHVTMFVSTNSNLEEMQIDRFMTEDSTEDVSVDRLKVLDLFELNKTRAQLAGAKKITLFVQGPVYLATKQAMRVTDLDFIKLKRIDSSNDTDFVFHLVRVFS